MNVSEKRRDVSRQDRSNNIDRVRILPNIHSEDVEHPSYFVHTMDE